MSINYKEEYERAIQYLKDDEKYFQERKMEAIEEYKKENDEYVKGLRAGAKIAWSLAEKSIYDDLNRLRDHLEQAKRYDELFGSGEDK